MISIPIDFEVHGCTYGGEFIQVAPDVWDLYLCGHLFYGQLALMDGYSWKFTPFDWSWKGQWFGNYITAWWESNAYLMR